MLQCNFDSALLLEDMSDHLPIFTLLKQTKVTNKEPLYFESHNLNDAKLARIKHKLFEVDWLSLLKNGTCSENFESLCNKVKEIMDTVTPVKEIRISSK